MFKEFNLFGNKKEKSEKNNETSKEVGDNLGMEDKWENWQMRSWMKKQWKKR